VREASAIESWPTTLGPWPFSYRMAYSRRTKAADMSSGGFYDGPFGTPG